MLGYRSGFCFSFIAKHRSQQALRFLETATFTTCVILGLVTSDFTDRKVARLGMTEVESADRAGRAHGEVFGE